MVNVKRLTVRIYNLRPGDVFVANSAFQVESAEYFPGTIRASFANVRFTNGIEQNGVNPDTMVTILRAA